MFLTYQSCQRPVRVHSDETPPHSPGLREVLDLSVFYPLSGPTTVIDKAVTFKAAQICFQAQS